MPPTRRPRGPSQQPAAPAVAVTAAGHGPTFVAFRGTRRIASGDRAAVIRGIFREGGDRAQGAVLIYDAVTSQPLELDLRGTEAESLARLHAIAEESAGRPAHDITAKRGPGRPRLGVVAREITLLPRHWEWLNRQPGGASASVRRLVEQARVADGASPRHALRDAQEFAYRFLSAMLGNERGFEDATRALFAGDARAFDAATRVWPADLRKHARSLASRAFALRSAAPPARRSPTDR